MLAHTFSNAALRGLEGIIGFRIKVVERTGRTLHSYFPLTRLWDGLECGRQDCITCKQGLEDIQTCNRSSLVYENICSVCNPQVLSKEGLKDYSPGDIPSIYIGETSRSLQERTKNHHEDYKRRLETSHILKHHAWLSLDLRR